MSARKLERHFAGRDNAGLRARIRETAAAHAGTDPAGAILALARTVALSASGRATLDRVAGDYTQAYRDSVLAADDGRVAEFAARERDQYASGDYDRAVLGVE